MTLPNFLIIGAARAGTTSLYHALREHPQVFMSPIKETNFFAVDDAQRDGSRRVESLETYQTLFEGARRERAIGEASPSYLVNRRAAEHIQRLLPQARLIAILRQPVERAHSAYLKYLRDGIEWRSFEQAVRDERQGAFKSKSYPGQERYLYSGCYHRRLSRYLERFDRQQIGLYLYDDLEADPLTLVQDIFRFLEVDAAFTPDLSVRYNPSGLPDNAALHAALSPSPLTKRLRRLLPEGLTRPLHRFLLRLYARNLRKPSLHPELRRELTALFRDDILRLQDLISRDLSHWLE